MLWQAQRVVVNTSVAESSLGIRTPIVNESKTGAQQVRAKPRHIFGLSVFGNISGHHLTPGSVSLTTSLQHPSRNPGSIDATWNQHTLTIRAYTAERTSCPAQYVIEGPRELFS
jgi:hypothetical protein